jgi:hypothetical protein
MKIFGLGKSSNHLRVLIVELIGKVPINVRTEMLEKMLKLEKLLN